jgi:hypothetical protein
MRDLDPADRFTTSRERRKSTMKNKVHVKSLHAVLTTALILAFMLSLLPSQAAAAQTATTSDLAVSLVSLPKHVKACQTFEAVFNVTNLGPDPASHLFMGPGIPDAFDLLNMLGAPESLAVGQTETVTVIIKVTGFFPGENRQAWVRFGVVSESALEPSIDPNPDNNRISSPLRIIGRPFRELCP